MKKPRMQRIPAVSIRDQVYAQIRDTILNGGFPAGYRLDLSELSADFGVSKTPLTEAIQKLTREGLVTVRPRSGTFVNDLKIDEVYESFGFRRAIEFGAAEMIVGRITDAEVAELKRLQDAMAGLLEGGGSRNALPEFLRLDYDFHDGIIAASGNALILDHYRQVNTVLMVARMRSHYSLGQFRNAVGEHARIAAALAVRDAGGFVAASREHLDRAEEKMRLFLEQGAE